MHVMDKHVYCLQSGQNQAFVGGDERFMQEKWIMKVPTLKITVGLQTLPLHQFLLRKTPGRSTK